MRFLLIIGTLLFCHVTHAVNIFGMDFYLRDSFVRVIDDERGTSIVLGTDEFFAEPGSTVLNPIQYEALTKVAKIVKAYPDKLLSITGHTDSVYSQSKRYQISDGYARRVADFLVDAGVDPDRIREVSGEGDLWPIAQGNTTESRHLNRRVEITFLHKAPPRVRFVESDEDEEEDEEYEEIEIEIEIDEEGKERRVWHIELEDEIHTPEGQAAFSQIVNEKIRKKTK
jgi:hypothetical protein